MRPEYENSICEKSYYAIVNGAKVIICNTNNEPCSFQRYCGVFLRGVHTSGCLSCLNK